MDNNTITVLHHVPTYGGQTTYHVSNTEPSRSLGYVVHRLDRSGHEYKWECYMHSTGGYVEMNSYEETLPIHVAIRSDTRFDECDTIYYTEVDAVSITTSTVRTTREQENALIFNVPINLIFAGVCSHSSDLSFHDNKGHLIMRVVRFNEMVTCYPTDTLYGAYTINLARESRCMNEICPRALEHRLFMRLIHCGEFVTRVNNGNLFLAFMDIYYGNNDDGTLNLHNPGPGVTHLMYNQYIEPSTGNPLTVMTEVEVSDGDKFFSLESDELDIVLVELLGDARTRRIAELVERHRNEEE